MFVSQIDEYMRFSDPTGTKLDDGYPKQIDATTWA
ncbi:MAG: hypothetical protein ACI8ZM_000684 [Crocinitomix sp.]|jgi:hypothetical protein